MPFQIQPTLPDYSKLVFLLNNSGVQKWNPAVYDILKNLIEAVKQSQDTFLSTTIEEITQNIIDNTVLAPSGAPILQIAFVIPRPRMNTLNTVPFVILAGTAGVTNIPIALITKTEQQRQFAGNVQGTLQYTNIPGTPITAQTTVVQGGLTPGIIVVFYANGIGVSASFAATLTPINSPIEMKGSADSADGGAAGAPDINQITGTMFYIQR